MRIGVLGPLEVDEQTARLGSRDRIVLTALAMRPGELLTPEQLADAIWGDGPPASWSKNLQGCVSRLRKLLGPGAIETSARGYRLRVPLDAVDATEFSQLAGRASELMVLREYEHARYVAAQGLGLWRGRPLAELEQWEAGTAEAARLLELHAELEELALEASLASGHHRDVLAQAAAMVEAAPLRERRWALLARAQYQAGHQTEALRTLRRIGVILQQELGLDPGPELVALEQSILRQDSHLLVETAGEARDESSPYLGLTPYGEADSEGFFGRESEVETCLVRLREVRLLAVVGASGSGKSSLLRAGLMPALRREGADVKVLAPGRHPLDALTAAQVHPGSFVVVDQAEEAFSLCSDDQERTRFFSALVEHTQRGHVVLAIRADHIGDLAREEGVAPLVERGLFLLGAMSAESLRAAIQGPARQHGLVLEPGLTDLLIREVEGEPGALPLLSHALRETWLRHEGRTLTVAGYQASGGIRGAVAQSAETLYGAIGAAEQTQLRDLVLRLVVPGPEGEPVRGRVPKHQAVAAPAQENLVDAMVAARLVTSDDGVIALAHEALVRAWPRLRGWLEDDLAGQQMRHRLTQATEDWTALGRQDSELYRGARLAAVREWIDTAHPQLTADEQRFLDASRQLAAAEEQSAADLARTRGRMVRRLRLALGGAVVLLVLALVAGFMAVGQARRAQQASLNADAHRLAALSGTAPDIATSSLLAAAAFGLQDNADTRGALLDAVERNQSALWRMGFRYRLLRIAATPDGSRLAISANGNRVSVVDPRARTTVATFPAVTTVRGVQARTQVDGITGDGRYVITSAMVDYPPGLPAVLVRYEVANHHRRVLATALNASPEPVTASDGRWVAAITTRHVGHGQVVDVFDAVHWTASPDHFVTRRPVIAMAAGRSALAIEHPDGSVEVRAVPSWRKIGHLAAPPTAPEVVTNLAITADGSRVARTDPSDPRRALIYELGTGRPTVTALPTQPDQINTMRFAPDGAEIAIGSADGSVAVYRAGDGTQLGSLAGHDGSVTGLTWTGTSSPSGLYSVGLDSELISWDLGSGPRTVHESGPTRPPPTLGSITGSRMIGYAQRSNAPNSTNPMQLFTLDLGTGRYASWSAGFHHDESSGQVVASNDGHLGLVSIQTIPSRAAAAHSHIEIVDMRSHRDLGHLALPPGTSTFPGPLEAAISPDGRYAYCALGRTRIGVFSLPTGKYLRSFTVRFAPPESGRITVDPGVIDPAGRLTVYGADPGPDVARPGARGAPDQRFGLVDVASGRLVAQTRLGDIGWPSAVTWSHDGRTMALGTAAGTLALYNASTLAPLADAGVVSSGYVNTVDFSPDDQTLVTGDSAGSLAFWSNPGLDREGQKIVFANGGVWAGYGPFGDVVGLAPDQSRPSGAVRWFHMPAQPRQLLTIACRLAGGDPTRAEWQHYVGDRPYERVCPPPH
jgi:DNA-binding SARP family transcriptional activator/WD40 repeat protein